ncbi:putative T7SS-secreted protein [Streptomyces sp. NBC_00536]|uniref:putative T7SS-secreted protein n=1 Tax=Streptomyces sp. NBC_00536 TaxID=2975769 RepID=UPI002E80BFAD|nr:polymorphic toxin type 28 domain-containing protein [Streptomyces sp. NBC_00536]
MGLKDYLPDWMDGAAETVGEGVEWVGDRTADTLEAAGWQKGANAVRETVDSAANWLGADVAEVQLGQSDDPTKLVHGSAAKLRSTAAHLSDLQAACDRTGGGLKRLDSAALKGESADAFRAALTRRTPPWFKAADAFAKASGALTHFADTVEWAQGQAREAIAEYKSAVKTSETARSAYNHQVDSYNAALDARADPLPARPTGFTDPGAAGVRAAHDKLAEARRQRDDASRTAVTALEAARDAAPPMPSFKEQQISAMALTTLNAGHVGGGVIKGTAGLVTFVRGLDPHDPYNATHPAEYRMRLNQMAAGLLVSANDPVATGRTMVDGFLKDPGEGIGKLIPEIIATKGMGRVSEALRAGRLAEDLRPGAKGGAQGHGPSAREPSARDELRGAEHDKARDQACKTCEGDPVDVATGRMVLPQTDLVLPGSPPLIFSRTFESSYRSGRWFGPTWASTVDQRLEIDAEGVVLVRADGSLLAYPHPAPGVPVLPSLGQRWPLTRDPDGGYTVTDPESGEVRHFSPEGLLTQQDDRSGAWISYTYDEETGAPLRISHSGGYEVTLTSADGRITGLSAAGTTVLRYSYTDGHLTEVTNSSGRPLRFGYDELGRITSWTDTNDRRFDYAYDDRHRCVAQSGTNGHLNLRFAYADGLTTLTNSLGHRTVYEINDRAQIMSTTDPTGATTRFTHDRHHRLLSRTDPLGHTTRFEWSEEGHLVSVARPDGRATRAEYDAQGLPVRVLNPDGTTVRQTYDAQGRRTSVTGPSGATTRFTHDTRGHLASVTDALGAVTTVRSNPAGLVVSTTDPLGATTTYERDAFGRPTAVTDPLNRTTHLTWSVEGRLLHRTYADGTTESWTYDGEGNCLTHTDALGGVTVSEYGDFDLLVARTAPDGARHAFTHDTELRLTEVTNPQHLTWSYSYDSAGRLASETDFDARVLTYAHDPAGRLTTRTNALSEVTHYEHNALGQVTRKQTAAGPTVYEYDVSDHLASVSSPDSTITWLRDRAGRIRAETVDGRTLTHAYDALGRRTTRTTPSGARSHWTYDAAGNRSSLTTSDRTLTFTHDAAGQELARTMGPVSLTQEYDDLGRPTTQSLLTRDGRTLQRRGYSYRADGHLTGIEDSLTGPRTFTLDAAARVTSVEADSWSEQYAYDDAGNQTAATWPDRHPGTEARGARSYTGTRIRQAGAVRYEYDALGRTVLRQKTRLSRKPDTCRYEWNSEDQLAAVTTPDGARWTYTYDPLGRRTSKRGPSEEIFFTWDGATLCEQTTGPVTLTWTHRGLHPLTQTEHLNQADVDDRFFTIITDLIGTPTQLIDEAGETAWHTRTTLWGTTTWNRDATTYTPLRFPGQYYDPESGLHHNVFRTYDPETARYLTPDPLGLSPAPNPATYVHNPHTWSDPLGLAACTELGLSSDAQRAIEKLENIKMDPVGEINSQPNHNHYDAARREAGGEVVARKPDGTPFDHIQDLQQARSGLDNVRRVLERETQNLPDTITDRGLEVLITKRKETIETLDRLNGFLHSIGHRK